MSANGEIKLGTCVSKGGDVAYIVKAIARNPDTDVLAVAYTRQVKDGQPESEELFRDVGRFMHDIKTNGFEHHLDLQHLIL